MTGRFRPQRWYPRYASVLEKSSRLPGLLAPTTAVLTPVGKDRTHHDDELPTGAERSRLRYIVCSFPRTGTTYLHASMIAAGVAPSEIWKTHNVFDIPTAQRSGIPVFITARDPLATVLSWSVYNSDGQDPRVMQGRFDAYTTWYRQALRSARHGGVMFIPFSDLTERPDHVATLLGLDSSLVTPERIMQVLNVVFDEEQVAVEQGHVPSTLRHEFAEQQAAILAVRRVERARRRATQVHRLAEQRIAGSGRRWPWLDTPSLIASTGALGAGAAGLAMGLRLLP